MNIGLNRRLPEDEEEEEEEEEEEVTGVDKTSWMISFLS